jgi:hypothetical protein
VVVALRTDTFALARGETLLRKQIKRGSLVASLLGGRST